MTQLKFGLIIMAKLSVHISSLMTMVFLLWRTDKMCKLICLINLFVEQQDIYLVDLETGKVSIAANCAFSELSEKIVDIADITKVNNIESRNAPMYAAGITEDIYTYARTKYNNNEIQVEVVQ
jgi:hypothetical protein